MPNRAAASYTLATLVLLLAALAVPSAAAQSPGEVRITLFHDTHLHGNLEGPDRQTFAHYVGLIRQVQATLPNPANSLFVGNGDDIASSLMSGIFRGDHVIDVFNAARLDVDTFGNHEFDLGPDRLQELVARSRFPWVSANVRDARTGDVFAAEQGARQWLLRDVGGVRLGFTGLAPESTLYASSPGPNVRLLDPVAALREVVPRMRAEGAQVVVVLSHLCSQEIEQVVTQAGGVDVAVGDHCARVLEQPRVVGGTIISQRGDELRLLGQLDLYVSGGRVVRHGYVQHRVTAEAPQDAAVAEVVNRYRGALDAELQADVGITTVPLDVTRPIMRSGEAAAGNLVADALRAWGGADVGLQNGGGVRGERTYGPGMLTRRDVSEMLPFPNYATLLRVSGAQLVAALENGVSRAEEQAGRFPQVSGLTFVYDPQAPAGARVRQVVVGGRPLDPNASYTLATIDFLAGGGDEYTALRDAEVVIPGSGGPVQAALLMDYIASRGSVSPAVEGRIRTVQETAVGTK